MAFLALAVVACAVLFAARWPFTRSKVIADLEEEMRGRVEIGRFHQTWFPPGCVAEDVTVIGYGNLANSTPITVRRLTIQGSFHGLFTKRVSLLRAEGASVVAPNADYFSGSKQTNFRLQPNNSDVVVEKYVAVDSTIEFSRGNQPLQFAIYRLELSSPDAHNVMKFQARLRNPMPPGDVQASGYLGPWKTNNRAQTVDLRLLFFHGR